MMPGEEIAPGAAVKVSEARQRDGAMREGGAQVRIAPTSASACHLFPDS